MANEKGSIFKSLWFGFVMSIFSLLMFADYTRLVLTTDDSMRRKVVLLIWFIIAIGWIITFIVRLKSRIGEGRRAV